MSEFPTQEASESAPRAAAAPPMPPILYEDDHLLAVDKPAGLVTHPTYKHPDGTLTDAVFLRQAERGEARPCLLHRLDRHTSGVVLFAKTPEARRRLVRQFERRTVRKQYLAVVAGKLPESAGIIEAPLCRDLADRRRVVVAEGGEWAVTRYRVLAAGGQCALVLAEPHTGRTHQIRAHVAHLGAPLAGDATYAPEEAAGLAPRPMLHAWRLAVTHPCVGGQLVITAPIPDDFLDVTGRLALDAGYSALAECS